MSVILILVFAALSLASEEQKWPWNPGKNDLDVGEHASFTEVTGRSNYTIQILADKQHNYLAIKDQHFNGCYLIDTQISHLNAEEITKKIKKQGVAVLPGEFDIKYPNIPHKDVIEKFGHRIGHFCKHNPTMWLTKHTATAHGEL